MDRAQLPLNALRAFEAAARHLNFTRAARELCVSQAALSHQIKGLEERLGFALFRRLSRGVALTDEATLLVPALQESFDNIGGLLDRIASGRVKEIISIGVVSSFATGWLLPRLDNFRESYPDIDIRIFGNNNVADIAAEGLNYAIRFGDGSWHGHAATAIIDAPLVPMCSPALAHQITCPKDLEKQTLLRSYRADEWPMWFEKAGSYVPRLHGPIFDNSLAIAQATTAGLGVGLLPKPLFQRELKSGRLVCPLSVEIETGKYWLTRLHSRAASTGMNLFKDWLLSNA